MAELFSTATEFLANELTILRGTSADITAVGVYHDVDPQVVPAVLDFTTVALVEAPDPLAEGDKIDVLSLIGPRDGDLVLTPGDYQRWVLVTTAVEDVIRQVDVLEVL